jgi:HPr kinase/phosphorylase
MSAVFQSALKPTYIHATAVVIGKTGLLIKGPSRAGKSSLALALLAEAAGHSLFARLIGDDRISVERQGEHLVLRGHPAIQGKIEQRGRGILDVAWTPSAVAHWVIDLVPQGAESEAAAATTRVEGVELALLTLPPDLTVARRAALVMAVVQKAK